MPESPFPVAQGQRKARMGLALGFGVGLCAGLTPVGVQAFSLEFPVPATALGERRADLTSYRLPTGPFRQDAVPTQLTEGNLDQTAWRLDAAGKSTLQILAPLRDQIAAAGWATLFECETEACGGFDFRYGIDVLPEPEMHVDLGDFRFIAARRDGTRGEEFLSLLVSRSADQGFVQMTLVGAEATPDLSASTKSPEADPEVADALPEDVAAAIAAQMPPTQSLPDAAQPAEQPPADLVAALDAGQPFALEDLVFPSGMARLGAGDFPSLGVLAEWMAAHPQASVALVGHTDTSGSLEANTALSKKRAEAIREVLIARFGIEPSRITAQGVGPLSPRASDDTAEGRKKNRRVEVVSTPTRQN